MNSIVKVAAALSLLALSACAVTGQGTMYVEPTIQRQNVQFRRVAIVPNRLPANLQNPEYWRKFNHDLLTTEFKNRGFDVVDYESTVKLFEASGLPLEDTRSSRDKYAEFARNLGVETVIVPYYGTFAHSQSAVIINKSTFVSVLTLQVYLASANDFIARIDASGSSGYEMGYGMLAGISAMIALTPLGGVTGSVVGGVFMLGDLLFGIMMASQGPDSFWRQAFVEAVRHGTSPFFATYRPGASGYVAPPSQYTPPPAPSQGSMPMPPPPGPSASGCTADTDCKAGRVCRRGACTSP